MKVITFGSIKGGTGKTSSLILLARAISKNAKVLLIDLDINNSLSFTFLPTNLHEQDPFGKKYIAAGLQSADLADFVIKTDYDKIDIIQSSLYLVDLRTININRLKNLLKSSSLDYDYILIDTAPTYDNISLMAYEAADLIITPVMLSQFDFNTSMFLAAKLKTETTSFDKWRILYNCIKPDSSIQKDYTDLFENSFSNILTGRIPNSSSVRNCIDRKELIGSAKGIQKLRNSILDIASEITDTVFDFKEAF